MSKCVGVGRASVEFGAIFNGFLSEVQGAISGIGQYLLNQGLSAVLGGLRSFGGSRAIGDIFACKYRSIDRSLSDREMTCAPVLALSQQIGAVVTAAQGAVTGALNNLSALGSNLLDALKLNWEQLQEQLVGHGFTVLGSISENINNLHGSIAGDR